MRERSATGVPIRTLEHTRDHMYHYILLHAIWLIPTVLPALLPEVGAICFCSVDPLLSPTVQPTCPRFTTIPLQRPPQMFQRSEHPFIGSATVLYAFCNTHTIYHYTQFHHTFNVFLRIVLSHCEMLQSSVDMTHRGRMR